MMLTSGKRMLRFLSLLLVCMMLLPAHARMDDAVGGKCGETASWTLENGVLHIRGSGEMEDYKDTDHSVSTPWYRYVDEIFTVVVDEGITSIGDYAFSYCFYLTKVSLPEGLTRIGNNAFWGDFNLLYFSVPGTVTELSKNALRATGLYGVSLPAGLKSIGEGAFYDADQLREILYDGSAYKWESVAKSAHNEALDDAVLRDTRLWTAQSGSCGEAASWSLSSEGVLTISGSGAVQDYSKDSQPWAEWRAAITSIVVREGIERLGQNAFQGCYRAESVSLPESLSQIGAYAFSQTLLESVRLPENALKLGTGLFSKCYRLQEVTLPSQLESLPEHTFSNCQTLRQLRLPGQLKRIGSESFYSCMLLHDVVIPASVEKMSEFVFVNCYELDTLTFEGPMPSGINGSILAENSDLAIRCREEYLDEYRTLLDFTFNYAETETARNATIFTGPSPLKLETERITLSADKPSQELVLADQAGVTAHFTSLDPTVASVTDDGVVWLRGHGRTVILAELRSDAGCTLTTCLVKAQNNTLLVDALPDDPAVDYTVICSTYTTDMYTGELTSFRPAKLVPTDKSDPTYQEILAKTKELTQSCRSDVEKARAIQGFVSDYLTYWGSLAIGEHVDQIYSVWKNRESHCQGFCYVTGLMLAMAGIPSGLAANEGHMWNVALLDGVWTMLDSTWGEFDFPYEDEDHGYIEYITLGQEGVCLRVDDAQGLKLIGVGDHLLERDGITDVVVPEGVKVIFGSAFEKCGDLRTVTLPKSLEKIQKDAFEDCAQLSDVYYRGPAEAWAKLELQEEGNAPLLKAALHAEDGMLPVPGKQEPENGTDKGQEKDLSTARFEDVPEDAWYAPAVYWAREKGITTGKTDTLFAPGDTCTRAQAVTFLWRAMGQPAPSSDRNPFADVKSGDYFRDAVLWAVEQGITTGVSQDSFGPSLLCTQGHILTFLWRCLGKPGGDPAQDNWYDNAVNWAGTNRLLTHVGENFYPNGDCLRSEMVYYLYASLG